MANAQKRDRHAHVAENKENGGTATINPATQEEIVEAAAEEAAEVVAEGVEQTAATAGAAAGAAAAVAATQKVSTLNEDALVERLSQLIDSRLLRLSSTLDDTVGGLQDLRTELSELRQRTVATERHIKDLVEVRATLPKPGMPKAASVGETYARRQAAPVGTTTQANFITKCPLCNNPVNVLASQRGQQVECAECHCVFQVPLTVAQRVVNQAAGAAKTAQSACVDTYTAVSAAVQASLAAASNSNDIFGVGYVMGGLGKVSSITEDEMGQYENNKELTTEMQAKAIEMVEGAQLLRRGWRRMSKWLSGIAAAAGVYGFINANTSWYVVEEAGRWIVTTASMSAFATAGMLFGAFVVGFGGVWLLNNLAKANQILIIHSRKMMFRDIAAIKPATAA